MKWILNRKKKEVLKSVCAEIIMIVSILMMILGIQMSWKLLGEKKSQWYESEIAYSLTNDRFISQKAEILFMLLSVIMILIVLAGAAMYLIIRKNILLQLKRECYYLKLFGYRTMRITGILFFDVCFDLCVSLFIVLPAEIILWKYIREVKMIQTLLLLTESGTDLKYFIIVLVYAGVFCVSLLQIIIRKERRRYNGSNRRGKRFGKSI